MEQLIMIAEDSPRATSIRPQAERTVECIKYELLIGAPYKYTKDEFFEEVHYNIRGMKHLKIETYSLKRTGLVKRYGWGIHINTQGRIALVPCESEKYSELLNDPQVSKVKSYRNGKKMIHK